MDDLHLAIAALKCEKSVTVSDGKLAAADLASQSSSTASDNEVIMQLGARRLAELIHGNAENKAEATRRGAMLGVSLALSASTSLETAATLSRAVKGLVFKNAPGREQAQDAGVTTLLVASLGRCADVLVALEDASSSQCLVAVGCLQESIDAITAVCMMHDGNTEAAKGAGIQGILARSSTRLLELKAKGSGAAAAATPAASVAAAFAPTTALTPDAALARVAFAQSFFA
jgi:hypothetical protein